MTVLIQKCSHRSIDPVTKLISDEYDFNHLQLIIKYLMNSHSPSIGLKFLLPQTDLGSEMPFANIAFA